MGNNSSSKKIDNQTENEEQWDEENWEGQQESNADVEVEIDKKDLDVEKAKIRKSIEDFQEQKRLKELLGDDYED